MKRILIITLLHFFTSYSQGNCTILYPNKKSNQRKACELAYKAIKLQQGSRDSQEMFDEIIKLNPKYDWAYKEKSVPYFKRGFILKGLYILNKAIEINPLDNLTYRAYWFFQNRNYKKCIEDLEHYYNLPNAFYGELTPGGDMNMKLLLGMAYAKEGNLQKGIKTVEECIQSYKSDVDYGLFDYHILGVLYLKNKKYNKAVQSFEKQMNYHSEYFDSYYYLGLAKKRLGNTTEAKKYFSKALEIYKIPYRTKNGYLCFRVYKEDVLKEL